MFTASDIYLSSGTGGLFNSWPSDVSKFDTSSFYNWEQDNLPIYDLEDRTNLLWEKLGFPVEDGFSGLPGIMLVVSGDATFTGESSGIIFKSVSSIIKVLPEIITIPIIIEVASFGDLGQLNLNNLKFKDRGGLEIINRIYSKIPALDASGNYSGFGTNFSQLSSVDAKSTLHNSKVVALDAFVVSATPDLRFEGNNLVYFCRAPAIAQDMAGSAVLSVRYASAIDGALVSPANSPFEVTGTANSFIVYPYDATKDLTISSYPDITVYNKITPSYLILDREENTRITTDTNYCVGSIYGNWFTKISVKNCNGSIYIRNFAVDGGSGVGATLNHNTDNGVEIENSRLVLENTLAIRCKENGFRIISSDVILNRGTVAMRNYTLTSPSVRSSTVLSTGFKAINSNIIVSSSPYASGINNYIHVTKNIIGMELINSRIIGGQSRSEVGISSGITYINAFYNNREGLLLNNSYVEIPGRTDCYNNDQGIRMVNSQLIVNEMTLDFNQTYGLKAENSYIRYNKDLYKYVKVNTQDPVGHISFERNGVNILLDKSNLTYTEGNSLPSKYGIFYVSGSVNVVNENGVKVSLPNIQVLNGSNAKIIHPKICNNQALIKTNVPVYGLLCTSKNNSKVVFIGSKDNVAFFIGPPSYTLQKYVAGLYANNASILEFQGPTFICNNGVDVLAEDQSIINFVPPRDDHGNILTSSFDLSNTLNHTKVELHATRACLVANKNSSITIENLGDYRSRWPAAQISSVDFNSNDGFGLASAVSGGYMQFYPNGQDGGIIAASAGRYDISQTNPGLVASPVVNAGGYMLLDFTNSNANSDILKYSTGGMCVRVVNGSIIKIKNVNFPAGWDNTSGILYDASGGNCDLLRIWNIGPDSEMDASYLSVSGLYPSLARYYGPSSVYFDGATIASGAVASVPDTGVVSVLDYYGASGATSATNYGPFRLFVAVDGAAKFLNYVSGNGLVYNSAYQTWSQGYNPSAPVSAAGAVSGYYKTLTTSAFLTTSAMVSPEFRSHIRLDQSAADSFANAKNGATSRSGRVAICTIYRSGNDEGSEAFTTSAVGHGLGLKSVNIFDLSRDC